MPDNVDQVRFRRSVGDLRRRIASAMRRLPGGALVRLPRLQFIQRFAGPPNWSYAILDDDVPARVVVVVARAVAEVQRAFDVDWAMETSEPEAPLF